MNILICNIILITVWINMKGGGFGYYNPSKNLIEYGNKGWQIHDDRLQRRVTYTNLPPGDYVFEVKSVSTDLYSNQPYKNWGSVILPPTWKTWWAYLLYGIFIVLVLYFIRHYKIVMMRLRNKVVVEQKLATLKMNFFTNVSHELRTPLNR